MKMEGKQDKSISRWLLVGGLIVVSATFVYYRFHSSQAVADLEGSSTFRGKPAAAFAMPDLDGKLLRLKDFKDKVVLINFWGTTCAPCKTEIPWLVEFQKQYESKGLQVIAISMYGETPDVLKSFIAAHGMEHFRVVAGTQEIAGMFGGIRGLPDTLIVDRDGRYYSKHEGIINRAEVENELAALFNGRS
jgi:cytochrome c biogenesis protein CcmG/thiol:disulfide interchange protein DsbE